MTATQLSIQTTLTELKDCAPSGYALAFHLHFTTPTYLFQTYPSDWLDYYSQNGLLMQDPTVLWGYENLGHVRWSELSQNDPAGVMKQAAQYGMVYGVTYVCNRNGKSSLGSLARDDREFTDDEIDHLISRFNFLHETLDEIETLSPETAAELRRLSVLVTHS